MKTILQTEASECGLACLSMVADYYGHKTDLNYLRQTFPQTLKGVNLQQLMGIADQIKLTNRVIKHDIQQFKKLKLPCILCWDKNHFVVLKSVSKNSIVILDPAKGRRNLSMDKVKDYFTGYALELTPAHDFEKADNRIEIKLSALLRSVTGLKPILFQLFLLSLILQSFSLAMPYYMQLVLDDAIVNFDGNLLTMLALAFAMLTFFNIGTSVLRSYVVIHLGASLNQQLAFNLFRHLIRLPLDYFKKRHIGDVVSRFGSLQQVQKLITNTMIEALIDGIMAITTLIMVFLYSVKLALIVCIAMLLYLIIRLIWYTPLRTLSEESIVAKAKENSNFMENIRGIQTIKLFGIETKRQALWQNNFTESLNLGVKIKKLNVGYGSANGLLFGLENIIVIYIGANLILDSTQPEIFTIGMLMAFQAYKQQLTSRFASLVDKFIEFKMLSLYLHRLADIAMTEQEENLDLQHQHNIHGAITLKGLCFRYLPNEQWLIKDLDVVFNQGESVAIIGPSGCGKTTLLKLILGLHKPEKGHILIDNVDLKQIGLRQYRSQISTVMQSDELLSGSLAENISQFDPQMNINKVILCAQMASIHEEICAMPMKYNSLISDMGATLSGGQKQRVILARALYRDPKILFLDEATSHLDLNSETKVNKAISQLNITRIIIAHRTETIKMADRILEFNNGVLTDITNKIKNTSVET